MQYHLNGFIVKRLDSEWAKKFNPIYSGIEGDTWPLDVDSNNDEHIYLDEEIDRIVAVAESDASYVGVCGDSTLINRYICECKKLNYSIEILFCETIKQNPKTNYKFSDQIENFEFLGYDYGYVSDDYYSCVYNDLLSRDMDSFNHIILNKNGLIGNQEELNKFIEIRNNISQFSASKNFEQGDFIPYKLWRFKGDKLM